MSIRKRNEYLDGDDSDEELENGYGSEAEEGRGTIATKRRKLDSDADSSDGISDDEEEPAETSKATTTDSRFDFSKFGAEDEDDDLPARFSDNDPTSKHDRPKTKKSKELKAYENAHKKAKKSGVVYISRVPPFMKPQTLKHFLEPHASHGLGRIFLTPEDHTQHSKRVKNGGNKKKSFTDGWIEFNSKKEAKLAAAQLNGNIIGGKKGGFYHDDIWNMKYLTGFKWDHLTEQISNENAERAARVREEIRRTRKENKAFVEDVERGKMLEGIEKKNKAKLDRGEAEDKSAKTIKEKLEKSQAAQRQFKQKKAKDKEERERTEKPFAASQGVRSKIF
ncbi:Putative nucleotide-binding alpha-beta plait domain superfamily, ABT1/ESF2, RNA recognition [Septoria linicola]|uniref:18S rRNA factor 2 n=1 Tax=Septoria linicola TaxID=215465 RepID=A0A9Q9ENI3_9PEZI|nr:Putative nucleotide-binding alpha-beta plait domain superfamily, ABT1/ESF2, RNA recognition [Septoria linicola]